MSEDLSAGEEARLVRRCAEGDETAWVVFVDRFGPVLLALARRMLARRGALAGAADAEEVTAEVFLALLRRDRALLRRFDPRFRLSTWLGVIVRTEVVRRLRRRRPAPLPRERAEAVPAPPVGGGVLSGLGPDERERALEEVRRALGTLSRRDRLLLELRYLEDLDHRSIASALGVAVDSVGPLLARARSRLLHRVPDLRRWLAME